MAFAPARAAEPPPQTPMSGDLRIHDPSILDYDGRFVAFYTGEQGLTRGAIQLKTSPDGHDWRNAGAIGKGVPKWGETVLGYRPTNVWAPSVSRRKGLVYLYYALSSFGLNASVIGLMTNAAFDPGRPGEGWVDEGVVLKSGLKDDFNAIDPYRIDLPDGRAFLAFGSFWSGIKLAELDPGSGKLKTPEAPYVSLADRSGAGVEAAAILPHRGRFYLFVSFDQCCKGIASTYNIRVGRADRVEGPYLDKDGRDLRQGGGSLLLGAAGRFIGPGGQEPVRDAPGDWLAYHYYDADAAGVSKLQVSPLQWDARDWPELGPYPP